MDTDIFHLTAAAAVLLGASILALSILRSLELRRNLSEGLRKKWFLAISLTALFILGYLIYAGVLLTELHFPLVPFTGAIFLGGSLFVWLVIELTRISIRNLLAKTDELKVEIGRREEAERELRRYRDELEELVRERTEELQRNVLLLEEEIDLRLNIERELQHQKGLLETSNQDLEQFAYIASHDLQEPLRKVMAFGDRLVSRYGEALEEQGRDYLMRMQHATGRMQSLIDGLLSFSRVNTRAQPFEAVDLAELLQEVMADLEIRIVEQGAQIDVGELPVVFADPLQMRQLFQNLLGNALKFTRPRVPPHLRIGAQKHMEDGWCGWRLSFRDNGIGFDEKYADRIFGVFQRLHGRSEYEGSGIGLSICRKIVQRHGGVITARSRPGEGATFFVDLPEYQEKEKEETS